MDKLQMEIDIVRAKLVVKQLSTISLMIIQGEIEEELIERKYI
jgi:hypothetical protein